jgi:transketolase
MTYAPAVMAAHTFTVAAKMEEGWKKRILTFLTDKAMATRDAGQAVLPASELVVPELFGGAADLTSSTKTIFKGAARFACTHGRLGARSL